MKKLILLLCLVALSVTNIFAQIRDTPGYHLQSRPMAKYCVYLDFICKDCGTTSPDLALALMASQHPSDKFLQTLWEVVAQDFIIFDINVTTDLDVYNSYDCNFRTRAIFGSDISGYSGQANGIGIVGNGCDNAYAIIGCITDPNPYNFTTDAYLEANTVSHEIGHLFGGRHNGFLQWPNDIIGFSYYRGNGVWAPIMGIGGPPQSWMDDLSLVPSYITWSDGNYPNSFIASNGNGGVTPGYQYDVINVIGSKYGFVPDDYITASNLIVRSSDDSVTAKYNFGLINNRNDIDSFRVVFTGTGNLYLDIAPTSKYTDLDAEAVLIDEFGNVIAQSNILRKRNAVIQASSLSPGVYYVLVKSGGEPGMGVTDNYLSTIGTYVYDSAQVSKYTGFSNYGSFGTFAIAGKVTNAYVDPVDIVLTKISGLDQPICSKTGFVVPQIEIYNFGSTSISSVTAKVYVNSLLIDTQIYSVTISGGQTIALSLNPVTQTGTNTLKVVISTNLTENNLTNNSLSKDFSLKKGVDVKVSSDNQFFNSSIMNWQILDNTTNTVIANYTDFNISHKGIISSQDVCLTEGCYKFNLTGSFNLCNSNYYHFTPFVVGGTYVGNDTVRYLGRVYVAKWWTQAIPPHTDYKDLSSIYSPCNENQNSYVEVDSMNTNIFPNIVATNFISPTTNTFCINPLTQTPQPGAFTTSSPFVCQGQNNVVYTVPNVSGTTYLWSYVSGTGATIVSGQGTNSVTINFSSIATNGTVRVIADNGGGASYPREIGVNVNSILGSSPVFIVSAPTVVREQVKVLYTVSSLQNATSYNWSYSGNGATIHGNGSSSVTIDFSTFATSGILSVTASNSCGSTTPLDMSIDVGNATSTTNSVYGANFDVYVYPNPFHSNSKIVFNLSRSAMVDLEIYNIYGVKIKTIFKNENLGSGHYESYISSEIPEGTYIVKLKTNDGEKNIKVIKQ